MFQWTSRKKFWQTLGRLRVDQIPICGVSVIPLAALVNVYRLGNDYALHVASCDGVDTVGVWGSNPHAPTNFIGKTLV